MPPGRAVPEVTELSAATVLVAGAGVTGAEVARTLVERGAAVTVVDSRAPGGEIGAQLSALGVAVIDPDTARARMRAIDLVVTSPGWRPDNPLARAADEAGVPVWGDVELGWRMDAAGMFGPPRTWLAVTGTNGKTTTVGMLEQMLRADGRAAVACGNIGLPVLAALRADPRIDVLAVELSSFQLHWAPSLIPAAGVVLNIAEDHLDWHGDLAAYTAAKARVLRGQIAVLPTGEDPAARLADTVPGRLVRFGPQPPRPGALGVDGDRLRDRAFTADAEPVDLAAVAEVTPAGPAGLADALAAAALARSIGVSAASIAAGLAGFQTAPHRAQTVAVVDQVTYIDDSKATNPHAARGSLIGRGPVVWIAGGLLKGAAVDALVAAAAPELRAVVLLGADRGRIAEALSRHAPQVPVVDIATGEDGGQGPKGPGTEGQMGRRTATAALTDPGIAASVTATDGPAAMRVAVAAARQLARPGDTVLLAPAAASLDMFPDYIARGRAFIEAVRALETS